MAGKLDKGVRVESTGLAWAISTKEGQSPQPHGSLDMEGRKAEEQRSLACTLGRKWGHHWKWAARPERLAWGKKRVDDSNLAFGRAKFSVGIWVLDSQGELPG